MSALKLGAAAAGLALSGCVSTAVGVVKAPFQVAGKAVDWTTTSRDEADRNRGRALRKGREREARERRAHERACRDARDPSACIGGYRGYTVADDPRLR